MNIEIAENPNEAEKSIQTKRERLKSIFELIEKAPPASTCREAYDQVKESFRAVEGVSIDSEEVYRAKMIVMPLSSMESVSSLPGIKFYIYDKHVLFISENGAIDVRLIDSQMPVTSKLISRNPTFPKEKMRSMFSKNGANGEGVWV